MQKQQADILLKKYREGTASVEEVNSLLSWIQQKDEGESAPFTAEQLQQIEEELATGLRISRRQTGLVIRWRRVAAAAAVMLLLLSGWVISRQLNHNSGQPKDPVAQTDENDIGPAADKATLTLADGRKIVLTKELNGAIAHDGGAEVRVNGTSALAYTADPAGAGAATVYNTLSTGRGEQAPFPLVLADGTRVWLNAASTLVFPTNFSGGAREVTLTGEAYFEVVHNSRMPFRVRSGNQVVEDIGTSFNISSYTDEADIRTTLVEGAAKVKMNGMEKLLSPGEQAKAAAGSLTVAKTDVDSDIAWMKGKFVFRDEELHAVMRQLSRWYDIDVEYEHEPTQVTLGGGFSKNRSISQVLKALEATGAVKFRIQGKKVIVTK